MAEPQGKQERLLIKVVLPKQGKERRVTGGGGKIREFRPVSQAFRASLSRRVEAVRQSLDASTKRLGFAPVRVKLLKKALAKSHRPEHLFSQRTCPIIGAGKLGELFVQGTDRGLTRLAQTIQKGATDQLRKEISSVDAIEPVTPQFRTHGVSAKDILKMSPKRGDFYLTQIQLFDFLKESAQAAWNDLDARCKARKIRLATDGYSARSRCAMVTVRGEDDLAALSNVVAVRSIRYMPLLTSIRRKWVEVAPKPILLPLPDGNLHDHPIVAVVDSGITDKNPELNQWIVGRESLVAAEYSNTAHGTFVAGLICWGKQFNPELPRIDATPCGVFDVQVLPNRDPDFGPDDTVTEPEFLQFLEEALRQHSNEIKVWNLSLGLDNVCSLDEFSPFAIELDRLQEDYDVSFVVSAGNFVSPPLLGYPRVGAEITTGRITSPADSVLGISVGAISHKKMVDNSPGVGEPAAFSRHGPGPNHIIKPDLVHYGGSISIDGVTIEGIRSIDEKGPAANIGTSFSAPLVSRALAQVYHHVTPKPSPVMARAILTHSARHPVTGGRVSDGEENFIGFGIPGELDSCLESPPWATTLAFEDTLRPGYYLEFDDFPFPPCLSDSGKYRGNIAMTVAFAPIRGASWGSEYCETHVEASFGVYKWGKEPKTKQRKLKFAGMVPPEHKDKGILYESYQVEKLRKWAPVRTHYRELGKGGVPGERWRLRVNLLCRHNIDKIGTLEPQRFALLVTISDPEKKAPVYDQMVVELRTKLQTQNIAVRARAQIKT